MAITLVGVGTKAEGNKDTPGGYIYPGIPTGTTTNDIMIMFMQCESTDPSPDAPAGWNKWVTEVYTYRGEGTIFWRRAESAAESAPEVLVYYDSTKWNHIVCQIATFRGCQTYGTPLYSYDYGVSSAVLFPAITTYWANQYVINFCFFSYPSTFSSWSNTSLSGYAEIIDANTTLGADGCIGVAGGTKLTAGAVAQSSCTASSSKSYGCFTFTLIAELTGISPSASRSYSVSPSSSASPSIPGVSPSASASPTYQPSSSASPSASPSPTPPIPYGYTDIVCIDIGHQLQMSRDTLDSGVTFSTSKGLYIRGDEVDGDTAFLRISFNTLALRNADGQEVLIQKANSGGITWDADTDYLTVESDNGTGIGKLDTGTWVSYAWYHIYVIFDPTARDLAAICSRDPYKPDLTSYPSYTYWKRVGSNQAYLGGKFTNMKQVGDRVYFFNASTNILTTGGAVITGTWVTYDVMDRYLPVEVARSVVIAFGQGNSGDGGSSGSDCFGIALHPAGYGGWYFGGPSMTSVTEDFENIAWTNDYYNFSCLDIPVANSLAFYREHTRTGVVISSWEDRLDTYY